MLLESLSELLDLNDVDEAATRLAGNWRRWPNFVWFGENDVKDPDAMMIGYLTNYESTLRQLANARCVRERLAEWWGDSSTADVQDFSSSFWGDANALRGILIRVLDVDRKATPAFKALMECAAALRQSPNGVIDESVFQQIRRHKLLDYVSRKLERLKNGDEPQLENRSGWASAEVSEIVDSLLDDEVDTDSDPDELDEAIADNLRRKNQC